MGFLKENLGKLDETNFRRLYDSYNQRIYSYALSITHSQILAQEVTQEIFIKIWEQRALLCQIQNIDAWFSTIVKNQCYTYLNRLSKERLVLQDILYEQQQTSGATDEKMIVSEYAAVVIRFQNCIFES